MEHLPESRVRQILEHATGVHVLVVGDLMLDRYVSGAVERISPEAPVPVVRVESEWSAVGGAANVANNAVSLGAECDVVGIVGDDAGGVLLRRELELLGVGTEGLVCTTERSTTMKTRVLARRQQVVRYDHEVGVDLDDALAEEVADRVGGLAGRADVIVVEDYNKGVVVPPVLDAVRRASAEYGVPTVVDPKRLRFFEFEGTTLLKPNAKELSDALGEPIRPDDGNWMEEVRARVGCAHLLVTLGEAGMALRTADGESLRVPAVAHSVYDVSGAGDTVTAVVGLALGAGATPIEAAVVANHAAALEVAKAGVATVSPGEILRHYRAFRSR